MKPKVRILSFENQLIALTLVLAPLSQAQTNRTWTGASSTVWNTAGNWTGGVPDTTAEVALFSNATTNDPASFGTAVTIGGFNLTGGEARNLVFTNTIALNQFGVDNSSSFNFNISGAGTTTLAAAQAWTIGSSGNTTFSKAIANGGFLLTLDGTGTGTGLIDSAISGTGGITKSGTGTWTLFGAKTYSGTTTVSAGTLRATTSASALGAGALTISGGTLELANDTGLAFNRNTTVSGNAAITSDVLTNGEAGVTQTLGTLAIGAQTLTINKGANVGSGTAGVTFGAVTLSGNTTFNASADTQLTLLSIASGNTPRILTFDGAGATTVTGVLADATGGGNTTSVVKNGTGTLVLSGTNTYNSTTTINAGTLSVNTIGDGNSAGNLGQASSNATNLVLGGGTLRYTGATASTNRAFTLTAATTSSIEVSTNTLTMSGGSATTTGALTKTGAGTLVLSGANGYTGLTTVSGGTLSYGVANALSSGAVTVNGGTLNMATFSDTVGAVTLTSGSITGTTGVLTGTSFNLNGEVDTSVGAILGGTGVTLSKTGAGIATLSRTNTYTGLTTVSGGTLSYGVTNALSSGAVTVNGGTLNMATFSDTVGAVTLTSGSITGTTGVLTGTSYALNGTVDTSISAILGGSGALTKTGAGIATLSGVNTRTGVTNINAGTLSVGTIGNGGFAGNLGQATNAAANLVLGGGTLQYTGATNSTNRSFTLTAGTSSSIDVSTTGTTLTMSGASTNTTGALTKTGAGTLILSGANLHTGLTTVSDGTLSYGVNNALSSGAVTVNGGTLNMATFSDTVGAVTLTSGSITGSGVLTGTSYTLNGEGDTSISVILAGTGALTKTGAGIATLSGVNTYSGGTAINGGAIAITAANNLGTGAVTFNNGGRLIMPSGGVTLTQSVTNTTASQLEVPAESTTTLSGQISGQGQLQKVGQGTLVLDNANNYSGKTVVNEGTLKLGTNGSINATNIDVFGGTFDLNGKTQTVTDTLVLGSASTAGTISGGGAVNVGTQFSLVQGSISSNMTGNGAVSKTGDTTVTLSGANTHTGVTAINAGTLSVATIRNGGVSSNLGAASSAAENLVLGGGSLQYTGASAATDRSFTLTSNTSSGIEVATSGTTLILNGASAATSGALNKTGLGTLQLNGANAHTGATNVEAGKLIVNGSTAGASAVAVSSGATLAGSGAVGGNTTISSGGVLAPGNSPGVLTVSGTTALESGSIFEWELDTAQSNPTTNRGVAYDGINTTAVTGTGAIFKILLTGTQDFSDYAFWGKSREWTDIFKSADGTTTLSDWAPVFSGGFQYSYNGKTVAPTVSGTFTLTGNSLTWSAVPEPSNALAGLLAACALLRRSRRRTA